MANFNQIFSNPIIWTARTLAQECEEKPTTLVHIIHPLDACYDSFCGWMNSLQLTEVILVSS
jgi:hypothetical protein